MTAAVVGLAVAVLLLSVLVVGLLRSHAEILRALHELGAGLELDRTGEQSPRPVDVTVDGVHRPRTSGADDVTAVVGTTLDDEAVAIAVGGQSTDTLLAFLSSGCVTCQNFWDAFREPVDVPGNARVVVVARGPEEESASALRERDPVRVPLVLSSETWEHFDVPGSPYFVYVDGRSGRVVGEGSAATWPQVAGLLRQAVADSQARAPRVSGNGAVREARDDAELTAAGIGPGHPSLYAAPAANGEQP
jgi:hypothetical protein